MKYKVMIVEDQTMPRELFELRVQASEHFEVALSIDNAALTDVYCLRFPVDLILMDVQTERRENGLAAVEKIKARHPEIKIVVVTSLLDYEVLSRARTVGADSLWYKDSTQDALMDVVRKTVAGAHVFPDCPPAVEIGTAKSTEFTKTERKVLRYLVRGLSYGKIAEAMGVEVTTVKYHVTNMLQKTNLENKLQLALAVSDAKMIADLAEK